MAAVDTWDQAKEEVRDRVDLVSVIEEHVALEDRGKHHFGLCPFHPEDTPSFCVTPEMGIYKCFGCNESGDVFDFVMEVEGVEFPRALRMLADRCGVDLPESPDNEAEDSTDLNEYALECYEEALWDEVGKPARDYLFERDFSEETIREFRLGYAPDGWRNLAKALKRDDHDLAEALDVGLLSTSKDNDSIYDRFRNRVMFPIRSPGGRVLGFGGRNLAADDQGPKYLNSPESDQFHKREVLYGIHQARRAMRSTDTVLMMEGYTDVLRCHQEGWPNAVATLGTAMTPQHVKLLNRYVDRVVLVYDGDEAGRRAAVRGGEEAFRQGLEVEVVLLEDEADPDDVLRQDPDRFETELESAQDYLAVRLNWLRNTSEASGMHQEQELVEDVASLLEDVQSDLRRSKLVSWLASEVEVSESVIRRELERRSRGGDSVEPNGSTGVNRRLNLEQLFFHQVAQEPEDLDVAVKQLSLKEFRDERHKDLFRGLLKLHREGEALTPKNWRSRLSSEGSDYLNSLLTWAPGDEMQEPPTPVDLADSLRSLQARRERGELARSLAEQDEAGEAGRLDDAKKALLREAQNSRAQDAAHETERS